MLKLGSILLSLWSVLNLLPSAWILVSILFRGGNAPGLTGVLTEPQVRALGREALAAANSIAVFVRPRSSAGPNPDGGDVPDVPFGCSPATSLTER